MRHARPFGPSIACRAWTASKCVILSAVVLSACASEIHDTSDEAGDAADPSAGSSSTPGSSAGNGAGATGGAGTPAGGAPDAPSSGGVGSPGGGTGSTPTAGCPEAPADASPSVLRRLSALEYQLTVQDLFQLPSPPDADGIPADTDKDGFKTFAEVQSVSAQHLRAYLQKAKELADALLADTARRTGVIGCDMTAPACLSSFVGRFGALAFRRPLEPAEVDSLTSRAQENGIDQTDQFRFVIESVLTMPSFLYRVEVGDKTDGLSTLTGTELASRLSFALWGRGPSPELLERAAQGELDTTEGLSRLATSMLGDPKARHFFSSFFRQWLSFDVLRAPTTVPMGWSNALLGDMQQETDSLLQEYAWTGKNFLQSLNANHTYASAGLAKFFALPAPSADGKVTFPVDHVRANTGLLTHPALLSAKSDGDKIAIRGNWLRETFLCSHMEIPAALQEEIGEVLVGLSPVEIVEKRNSEAACKGCHSIIDPIGVGFSQYDALGRFDATEDIAKYGVVPGLPDAPDPAFVGIAELSAKLLALPQVSECLAAKLFIYVNGRQAKGADACTLAAASNAFQTDGLKFPSLVKGLVEVPAFRLRRPAAVSAP